MLRKASNCKQLLLGIRIKRLKICNNEEKMHLTHECCVDKDCDLIVSNYRTICACLPSGAECGQQKQVCVSDTMRGQGSMRDLGEWKVSREGEVKQSVVLCLEASLTANFQTCRLAKEFFLVCGVSPCPSRDLPNFTRRASRCVLMCAKTFFWHRH